MRGSFYIGDWLVEPTINRLTRDGCTVQLELKLMDLLVFLAGHRGEVASKNEIIDGVWRAEFIAENTLTHSIADLRRALGDDARNPCYIENIPKRGYRVVAPVSWLEDAPPHRSGTVQFKLVTPKEEFPLHEGQNIVGRSETADVNIGLHGVSREHARITLDNGVAVIEDLGSKNGTYVRGEPLTAGVELRHGDEILLGHRLAVLRFIVGGGRTLTETIDGEI